jgi:hypothetical protein
VLNGMVRDALNSVRSYEHGDNGDQVIIMVLIIAAAVIDVVMTMAT